MTRWICPACEREFAVPHQSHVCVPGGAVAETFAGREPGQQDICTAIIAYLGTLGPVHVDAVKVGVFLKHHSKFAEMRPEATALSLALVLPRLVDDPRITRRVKISTDRIAHYLRLTALDDLDDQLRDWLGEAYDSGDKSM